MLHCVLFLTLLKLFSTLFLVAESQKDPVTEVNSSTNYRIELDFFFFSHFSPNWGNIQKRNVNSKAEESLDSSEFVSITNCLNCVVKKTPNLTTPLSSQGVADSLKERSARVEGRANSFEQLHQGVQSLHGMHSVAAQLAGEKQVKLKGCT